MTTYTPCAHCGTLFQRDNGTTRYCGSTCREQHKYERKKADGRYQAQVDRKREAYQPRPAREPKPAKLCNIGDCTRIRHGKGLCKMHYKRAVYTPTPQVWDDAARDRYHRKRAARHGARRSDPVMLADLIARGLTCAGCNQAIDLSLRYPDPMSRSIDHVVPLSRGGEHTLANTQLMHLRCNIRKGART